MALLEAISQTETMAERLLAAARRIEGTVEDAGAVEGSTFTLQPEQVGVYADFARYIADVAMRHDDRDSALPKGRIILPPRTGKTGVAGQIAIGAGLVTTFMVPKKILAEQAVSDFRRQLPDVPIGIYYGDEKDLVIGGINVTTYNILQNHLRDGVEIPWQIRCSALIFADEGHRSMTKERQRVIDECFDPLAIRVALTATPKFNDVQDLARFFPALIHEITVGEAVELGLLAPLRWWMYEVDEDASHVEVVAGKLQEDQLGEVMSAAPFFEQTREIRYAKENRDLTTLICCASRKQAYGLFRYLRDTRPHGTPMPELIVAETKKEDRKEILRKYALGEIDTIINVGVLIEGWNSPRCKLLIDLSPTPSVVRAEQKFFRVLTKWEGQIAHIHILIPKNLARQPILPTQFLEWSSDVYEAGELMGPKKQQPTAPDAKARERMRRATATPIEKVTLVSRIKLAGTLEKPKLNPKDIHQIRAVINSSPDFVVNQGSGSVRLFRWLYFNHPLFTGRGEQLLRFLGCDMRGGSEYMRLMSRLFPERAGTYLLVRDAFGQAEQSCYEDAQYMEECLVVPHRRHGWVRGVPEHDFELGWRALAGPEGREPEPWPDEVVTRLRLTNAILLVLDKLPPREEKVLKMSFALPPYREEYQLVKIAAEFEISRSRVGQLYKKALAWLRFYARVYSLKDEM